MTESPPSPDDTRTKIAERIRWQVRGALPPLLASEDGWADRLPDPPTAELEALVDTDVDTELAAAIQDLRGAAQRRRPELAGRPRRALAPAAGSCAGS